VIQHDLSGGYLVQTYGNAALISDRRFDFQRVLMIAQGLLGPAPIAQANRMAITGWQ
jgi:hypothetical protein